MKKALFIIIILTLKLSIVAQSATVIKKLGKKYPNKDDFGNRVIYDPLDNTLVTYNVTNWASNIAGGGGNLFLTKLDTCLNVIWDKEITNLAQGQLGGFSYYGGVYSVYINMINGTQTSSFTIVNINQSGNVLNTSPFISFPNGTFSGIYSVTRDAAGNHIFNGTCVYSNAGRIWNLKTDINGNVLWSNLYYKPGSITITPTEWDVGIYEDVDVAGNLYFSGRASSFAAPFNTDLNLIKTTPNGNVIWAYNYNALLKEDICGAKCHNNGIYLYGTEYTSNWAQLNGSILYFIDGNGNVVWSKKYSSQFGNSFNLKAPIIKANGNLLFSGIYYKGSNFSQPEIMLVEIDKDNGNVINSKSINIGASDILMSNNLVLNNSIYFLGASKFGSKYSTIIGKTSLQNYFDQNSTTCAVYTPTFNITNFSVTPVNSNYVVNGFTTTTAPVVTPTTIVRTNSLVCGIAPVALNNLPTSICLNKCLSLRDSSKFNPTSWLWTISGPATFTTINTPTVASVCFTNAGVYNIKLVVDNCIWKDSITKSIFVIGPNMVALASSSPACVQGSLSLSAPIAVTYTWSGPNNFSGFSQSVTIEPLQLSSSGIYSMTSLLSNGCVNNGTINVTVHPLNSFTPSISNVPCMGGSVAILPQTSASSYTWFSSGGIIGNNPLLNLNNLQSNANGIYTLVVTNNFGCSSFGTYSLNINPTPSVNFDSIPNNCLPYCISASAFSNLALTNVSWLLNGSLISNNINLSNYCLNADGVNNLALELTSNAGCVNRIDRDFTVYPKPIADFKYSPDAPTYLIPSVLLIDNSSNNTTSWQWNIKDTTGTHSFNTQNISFAFNEVGNYYITLKVNTDKGCTNEVTKLVVIENEGDLYVPNAFTPNGDGLNDVFRAYGFGVTKFEMQIFDRWGHLLFTSNNIDIGWNGSMNNKSNEPIKQDVYTYKITYYKGSAKLLTKLGSVALLPK